MKSSLPPADRLGEAMVRPHPTVVPIFVSYSIVWYLFGRSAYDKRIGAIPLQTVHGVENIFYV